MKLIPLFRLKQFLLFQLHASDRSHQYKPELKLLVPIAKRLLNYSTMLEDMGEVQLVHIEGTKTIMLTQDLCKDIYHRFCAVFEGEHIEMPPTSWFQRDPDHSKTYTITTREQLAEFMKMVHQHKNKHDLKKVKSQNKTEKRNKQYRSAVHLWKKIPEAIRTQTLVCIDVEAFEFKQSKVLEHPVFFGNDPAFAHFSLLIKHPEVATLSYCPSCTSTNHQGN